MAINIEWNIVPSRKDNSDGKPSLFPRIVNAGVVDNNELAEILANRSHLSKGTVLCVLDDLPDVIASLLCEGKKVDVSSLGRFRLSLGTEAVVTTEKSNTTRGIHVRGVNFQPSGDLLQSVGKPSFRINDRRATIVKYSATDLLPRLKEFMQQHTVFTSSEFAQLFHFKRSTALLRLKELTDMGEIKKIGNGKDTRYAKKENA